VGTLALPQQILNRYLGTYLRSGILALIFEFAKLRVRASDAFATVVQERIGALIVAGDSFLWDRREQIMALAAQHGHLWRS
jgi:hypothetical protein